MARTVTAPDQREWTVRRRWIPRLGTETLWGRFRRRFRRARRSARDGIDVADGVDAIGGCGDELIAGVAIAAALVVIFVLAAFVVIPLVLVVIDVVLLLLIAVGSLLARVLLGRPWLVDAHALDGPHLRWRVVGWRASGAKVDEVAELLAAGIVPPDGEDLAAPGRGAGGGDGADGTAG